MANYQEELANFRRLWNLPEYDLDQMAGTMERFRYMDAFMAGVSVDNTPSGQYVKWFSKTLSTYFEENTTPNEEGKYMSSFDAQAFYDSFKELVQAKYDADAMGKGKRLLKVEDVTVGEKKNLENVIANCRRNYKKTLPTLWMEKLKKGSMNIQDLQDITTQSYDAMDKKWYVAENEMAGNLTNVVAAREAMKQLRASRSGLWGWIWKVILNRGQNRQEKSYLEQLETQIAQLSNKGYNVNKVVEELTGKTVLGQDVNAQKKVNETVKTQNRPAKTQVTQVSKKAFEPVADKISEMANSEYINNLAAKLSDELPGNNMPKTVRVWDYQTKLFTILDKINELNENFDSAVENGADPKKEMAKVVHGIFKETVQGFSKLIIEEGLDKLEGLTIAAQIITNNLTAATINPNELGDVVKEYIEQNTAIYEEIVSGGKDYSEEIENYKTMLENGGVMEDIREPAFNTSNPFPENNADKSEPIPEEIKKEPIVINNK